MCVCVCMGGREFENKRQIRGCQYQKNKPWKVLTANPQGEYNNSSQAQGDYNTRGP